MKVRRFAVFAVGGLAAFLCLVSPAWACFVAGTSPAVSMEPARAPVGSRVSLTGSNWVADTEPVAIRWQSASGDVKAYAYPDPATGGAFSVVLSIPDAEPGTHMIYAVQPGSETQAVVVEITSPTVVTGPGSTGTGARTPRSGISTIGSPALPTTPEATPSPTATSSSGLPTFVTPATDRAAASAVVAPAQTRAADGGRPSAALVSPSVIGAGQSDEESPVAAASSPRSASADDVWSGLAGDLDGRLTGLADLPGAGPVSGFGEAVLGIGLALSGLVGLFGGFAVAEMRRRKAMVPSTNYALRNAVHRQHPEEH